MKGFMTESTDQGTVSARTEVLFQDSQSKIHCRADRLFANLMMVQWVAGIAAALWISPETWIGAAGQTHLHVWAAIFLGGTITSLPVLLAWKHPGRVLTRHIIAVGQMLMSALLIHLSGGRVETHFHVFGSLAFIAFYRDWRVLVTATVVVALDHMARGIFWPQSVFGVLTPSSWRWVEHAGWVVFEDTFLFISIRQSLGEAWEVATQRADLEAVNQTVERCVDARTRELQLEIQERIDTQLELEQTHKQLVETSRQAGMAEVATSVLHNVGNVLNSVNVSSSCLADDLRKSKVVNLSRVVALLREHEADLGTFMTTNDKGKQLPGYLGQLSDHLAGEQANALKELTALQKNIDHIKDIVSMQQSFAKVSGVTEILKVTDLVEDALRMNSSSLARHDIQVSREFEAAPTITIDRHKAMQILVNLVRNAKQSCDESGQSIKRLIVRVTNGDDRVRVAVSDNGIGIPVENLTRIFSHGFTTKRDGHGFGLHSGANAAREMDGSLTVHSDGVGNGATFTLELPLRPKAESHG